MSKLTDFRVAVLATDGFEETELTEPVKALKAAGARVTAPCAGTVLFAGAFPAYGHVVIAGCGAGTSIVLAGMATVLLILTRAVTRKKLA